MLINGDTKVIAISAKMPQQRIEEMTSSDYEIGKNIRDENIRRK